MARLDTGIKPTAFDSSTREVVFFNPSIMSRTPGLTPFPDSGGTRPWVVSPHPRAVVEDKLGAPEPASPCGWLWNSSRGLYSTAFAIVLCGVLLFVALGVRLDRCMPQLSNAFTTRFNMMERYRPRPCWVVAGRFTACTLLHVLHVMVNKCRKLSTFVVL